MSFKAIEQTNFHTDKLSVRNTKDRSSVNNVEIQFLFSAHKLLMLYICIKFHENILNGFRVV